MAARYFGVKVHVFSIGFGKQLYAKEWMGTTWQFALIPLGGYVQMKGQDDKNPSLKEDGEDSYNTKKHYSKKNPLDINLDNLSLADKIDE